jgi:tight adherence protein B
LQAQTGGALSETLEGLADVVRKRLALKAKGEAMAAQAKTSAIVLGVMPFVSGGAMYFLNPDYIGILFYDSIGKQMLGVAIAMLTTGGLVMYTMINKSLN